MDNNKTIYSNTFLKAKTEKVVSALYLVTSFLSVTDPMRIRLRESGDSLMRHIVRVPFGDMQAIQDSRVISAELASFLAISVNTKILSPMNGNIVKSELIKIIEQLENISNKGMIGGLAGDFFSVEGHIPGKQGGNSEYRNTKVGSFVAKNSTSESTFQAKTGTIITNNTPKTGVNGDRKSKILSIVQDKKEVSIKDISRTIQGVSEKTIQRDLVGLVEQGVLLKRGERRWSTYVLA